MLAIGGREFYGWPNIRMAGRFDGRGDLAIMCGDDRALATLVLGKERMGNG